MDSKANSSVQRLASVKANCLLGCAGKGIVSRVREVIIPLSPCEIESEVLYLV